jgi:hypothetical protein
MAGKNQIIEAIIEGVKEAQDSYNKAASSPLFTAPEYFMDVHIFQSIFKLTLADSLTLQHNNRDLLKSNSIRGRKIKELPQGSKIDIILWYSNQGKIRSFIEVKRQASFCKRDLRRICYMLKNNGQFGVLISGIYQSYNPSKPESLQKARRKLNNKLQIIENNTKASDNGLKVELIKHDIAKIPLESENDKCWIWRPVCFVVEVN